MRKMPNVTRKIMSFCPCHFLKVCFRPPKCPFKALFDAGFKRFAYYIKMLLWPDPRRFAPDAFENRKYATVLGEVRKPGQYSLSKDMTLRDLIFKGRGLTPGV